MSAAPHTRADFCRSEKPAIDAAQIRIIFISPRLRQRDVDWRCAARQLKATRAAYHAVLADAHARADFGGCESRVPIGGKFRVAFFCPR
jgi:hypothetical protein